MTTHFKISFIVCALGVLSACSAFDPGSLIVKPRVLGARVEVQGEPERSQPKPEESVELSWVTAALDEGQSYRWVFAACLPESAADGSCANAPLAFAQGEGPAPSFSFQVPDATALNGAESLVVLGLICDEGKPGLDAHATPRCQGERAHGTNVKLEVELDLQELGNLNPELDDTVISFDDDGWQPDQASDAARCTGDETLPVIKADGKKHRITLRLGAEVRELYAPPSAADSELEQLQISHFCTAGELDGQFSFVEPSDASERPELSLEWQAPKAKKVPAEGERVRFLFVVRDMRGGLAVTERALCAVR